MASPEKNSRRSAMLSHKNHQIFDQLTDAIIDIAKPQLLVLFGSQARGNTDADSDVDLLLVQDKNDWKTSSRRQEIGRIRRALPRVGYPIDLLLFTPSEIERWKRSQNHVIWEALQQGKVLYERR